jgi:hypothetical protein
MSRRRWGFTIFEAVLTLALVSLVLDLVAQGYQRLSTINQMSAAASQRTEILAQMQTLCSQISNGYAVTIVSPQQLQLNVVDPTVTPSLDTQFFEAGRLPWPLPPPPVPALTTPYSVQRNPYLITVSFVWQAGTPGNPGSILKNTAPVAPNLTPPSSTVFLTGLTAFQVVADPVPQLLHVSLTPYQSVNALNATAYMPLVP